MGRTPFKVKKKMDSRREDRRMSYPEYLKFFNEQAQKRQRDWITLTMTILSQNTGEPEVAMHPIQQEYLDLKQERAQLAEKIKDVESVAKSPTPVETFESRQKEWKALKAALAKKDREIKQKKADVLNWIKDTRIKLSSQQVTVVDRPPPSSTMKNIFALAKAGKEGRELARRYTRGEINDMMDIFRGFDQEEANDIETLRYAGPLLFDLLEKQDAGEGQKRAKAVEADLVGRLPRGMRGTPRMHRSPRGRRGSFGGGRRRRWGRPLFFPRRYLRGGRLFFGGLGYGYPLWYYGGYYYPWWYAYHVGLMDRILYDQYVLKYGAPPPYAGPTDPTLLGPQNQVVLGEEMFDPLECEVCGKQDNLSYCASCLDAVYCGEACRAKDEEKHKENC